MFGVNCIFDLVLCGRFWAVNCLCNGYAGRMRMAFVVYTEIWLDYMLECGILSHKVFSTHYKLLSWTTVYSNSDRHIMRNIILLLLLLLIYWRRGYQTSLCSPSINRPGLHLVKKCNHELFMCFCLSEVRLVFFDLRLSWGVSPWRVTASTYIGFSHKSGPTLILLWSHLCHLFLTCVSWGYCCIDVGDIIVKLF